MYWNEMIVISSTASSATGSANGSVATRARTELISSKCDWTRIWTVYNVDEITLRGLQEECPFSNNFNPFVLLQIGNSK